MSLLSLKSNQGVLSEAFSDFVALFFPEYCKGCSSGLIKGEEILCTKCLVNLPKTEYSQQEDNPVKEKFLGRLPLKYAWAFLRFKKSGLVQHLLHQLKYKNQPEIGIRLGHLFGMELEAAGYKSEFDLIIPLPLHTSRQRVRGFNQSTMFAIGLSRALNVKMDDKCCLRIRRTETQTLKTRVERWQNVKEAFLILNKHTLANKRVLLVDDVITTGATIEACGQKIIDAGCTELSVACIAEAQ